ncbi:MAG: alpha/beta fold hydrolase [Stenotrophomonas sp.]|uniref:alpha/beta fold hydrolase n=1 Tax=Stenotrophomonas sp. TaxID=69392 RepID=UPI003D6CF79A
MPSFSTSDGTQIFFTDSGQGRAVVLLHGWPLSSAMWERQAMLLAQQGYRVICPDRRGFGRSDQPWLGYGYDRLADDLQELLEHLDLHEVTLVGFSMASGEVIRHQARHGHARVAQVVLMAGTAPLLAQRPDNPEGVATAVLDGLLAALAHDRPGVLKQLADDFLGGDGAPPPSDVAHQWYMAMALQASARATSEAARSWFNTDLRADLARIKVPTLVMHGGADASVPATLSGRVSAAGIAGARYIEYPQAGHALVISRRAQVEADLLQFLEEWTAGATPAALQGNRAGLRPARPESAGFPA